ncbi:MAG: alcohol dehydrogenase catalytic domain-containing protein [Sedimentisphaerales bacterium]|nr:alcohol dehydrogenase catalytic domain-containing protein [Sedimentisphaerales bacterium]
MESKQKIPTTQYALELIGPDKLRLNNSKEVYQTGPYQILAKVEAVGLCFSDLKLLKQFDKHARKSEVLSGIDSNILKEIPSYKPGRLPAVPGHEACCKIVATGDKAKRHQVGQRVLIETDYRWLTTEKSNAAFGYNFEGGLQQYVLMDERIIVDPDTGESFLIPVESDLSASAIALVEPWACVENAYITEDRNRILPDGELLVVADSGFEIKGVKESFSTKGKPCCIYHHCSDDEHLKALEGLDISLKKVKNLVGLVDESFKDIVYFGSDKKVIETLNTKLSPGGIINIVLAGRKISTDIAIDVGRVHYGQTRWIGTVTDNASDGYKNIPQSGEVRNGDKIIIIGAAGPMGQMHVIRLLCCRKENISITATDFDDERINILEQKTRFLARKNNVELKLVNPHKEPVEGKFSYHAIMAPVGSLVARAVKNSLPGSPRRSASQPGNLINIFAGIPAGTIQEIDLDTYISNRCYMFGTSGSRLIDMKVVLEKVTSGALDTNLSVDAVSGMAGAIDGIRAVENRTLAGKIIVYPALEKMGLINLSKLSDYYPSIADKLESGLWTKEAEEELLKIAK